MEPASNQLEAGSTVDLDPSDKEAMESSEEDYKDPEPEPMWIGRITDEPTLVLCGLCNQGFLAAHTQV